MAIVLPAQHQAFKDSGSAEASADQQKQIPLAGVAAGDVLSDAPEKKVIISRTSSFSPCDSCQSTPKDKGEQTGTMPASANQDETARPAETAGGAADNAGEAAGLEEAPASLGVSHGGAAASTAAANNAAAAEKGKVPDALPHLSGMQPPSLLRQVSKYANEDLRGANRTKTTKTLSFADDHGAELQHTCYTPTLFYSALGVEPPDQPARCCAVS